MEKLKIFILSIILVASLTACGSTEPTSTNNVAVEAETQVVDATATEIIESVEVETEVHTEVAVETEVTEIATEATEIQEPVIVVKELNQIMYATGSVNTRSGDSTDYEKIGSLSLNQEVLVTGQSERTGWYRISVNGQEMFVSNNYLSTEKTVVQTSIENTSETGNSTDTGNSEGGSNDTRPGETTRKPMDGGDGGEYGRDPGSVNFNP